MNPPAVTLYGYYYSSTSYRARILLNLKSVDYQTIEIRLDRGEQREPAFRAINPMGALPVLDIDGMRLTQSSALSQYVEERFPDPVLIPTAQPARQRVREIMSLIACDMHPVNNLSVLNYIREQYSQDSKGIADWYRHWIRRGFDALEIMLGQTSADGQYCVGSTVSMADIFLIPQVANARRIQVSLDDYPVIRSIDTHCTAISAFERAHPRHHAPADKPFQD